MTNNNNRASKESEEKAGQKSGWGSLIIMAAVVLLIRSCAYEPFHIPSESMLPNLKIGDYLFVSKLSYGYGMYSTPVPFPLLKDRVFFKMPERGDVVVFREPGNENIAFIKRVMALPGDTVKVTDSQPYINGKPIQREKVADYRDTSPAGNIRYVKQYKETLENGKTYSVIEMAGNYGQLDNTRTFKVPEGHFFVMGDNRDASRDSRAPDLGYVPIKNLVGRADLVFFSVCCNVKFWQVWKLPFNLRADRFFKRIQADKIEN